MESEFFKSFEKVLRSLIPGVVFCLLLSFYYPDCIDNILNKYSTVGQVAVFTVVFTIGFTIYMVHKLVVIQAHEIIAYSLFRCSPVNCFASKSPSIQKGKVSCLFDFLPTLLNPCAYSKAHAKLIIFREESKTYPKSYSYLLWASLHYSFIVSELLLFFAYFHNYLHCHPIDLFKINEYDQIIKNFGFVLLALSSLYFFFLQLLEKNMVIELNRDSSNTCDLGI